MWYIKAFLTQMKFSCSRLNSLADYVSTYVVIPAVHHHVTYIFCIVHRITLYVSLYYIKSQCMWYNNNCVTIATRYLSQLIFINSRFIFETRAGDLDFIIRSIFFFRYIYIVACSFFTLLPNVLSLRQLPRSFSIEPSPDTARPLSRIALRTLRRRSSLKKSGRG